MTCTYVLNFTTSSGISGVKMKINLLNNAVPHFISWIKYKILKNSFSPAQFAIYIYDNLLMKILKWRYLTLYFRILFFYSLIKKGSNVEI